MRENTQFENVRRYRVNAVERISLANTLRMLRKNGPIGRLVAKNYLKTARETSSALHEYLHFRV